MAAPSFEDMEKTASADIPKGPSFEEMEKSAPAPAAAPAPGLHASATKNVKAKAQTPDWLNFLHNTPVLGDVTRGAEQVVNNAGQAANEFQKDPMSSGLAAVGGAASGATGAVEAPVALAGNVIPNLLIPQGMRTQRQFPGQVAGTPEEQASMVLKQKTQAEPQQYSYGQMVGGNPMADRIQQTTQRAFPNEPGSIATGQVAGGLAVPMKGLGVLSRQSGLAKLARGAAEGALIGEGYHLGEQASHGQPMQPAAAPALGGALVGGALHTPVVKGTIKATGKAVQIPGKMAGRTLGIIKPKEVTPIAEKKVSAIIKQKEGEKAVAKKLTPQLENQAAFDYIKATQGGRSAEEPAQQQQGRVEENVQPEETEKEVPEHVKQFYEEWGKEPVPEAKEEKPNPHEERVSVPASEVFEADPNWKPGGPKYTVPFDITNPQPRLVKWRGILHGAEPHPRQKGQVTILSNAEKGRGAAVLARGAEGRTLPQILRDAEVGLTPRQESITERTQEEDIAGQTKQAQGEAARKAARINEAVKAIEGDDLEGLKKLNEPPKKLSSVKKPTILRAEVIPGLTAITDMAEQAHETPSWAAQKLLGNDWVKKLAPLFDVRDTLDRIKDGATRNESTFYDKLMMNHAQEALDTLGEDITEGQKGLEVRNAVRKSTMDEILDPEKTPDWSPETRMAAAKKKHYYDEQKAMMKDEIKEHADDKEYVNALKEYNGQLSSHRNEIDDAVSGLNHKLYESALLRNPAYHGLVSLHPFQAGSTVAGPGNIAEAYSLIHTDPKINAWLSESARNITGDYRSGFREEMYAKEGKEAPKDIPTSRWNNDRILLAGMLKKGGVKGVHDLIDNFNEGKPPTDADAEVMLSGLETLRDATGNIIGGGNRPFTTRHPIYRFVAQMSGYRGTIDRLLVNSAKGLRSKNPEIKAESGRRIATLLAATTLMGGSAPVPDEVRSALWKMNPRAMYALEYTLNQLNVAKRIPIVGRDLSKHTRFSFLNWGKNLSIEAAEHWKKALGKQWNETADQPLGTRTALLVGRALWEVPWSMWGFGGSTIKKELSNLKYATSPEHEKPVYAFNEGHILKSGVRKNYGLLDALADNLPGDTPEVANWEYKQYVKHMFNLSKENLPENLESDYASPSVEDR